MFGILLAVQCVKLLTAVFGLDFHARTCPHHGPMEGYMVVWLSSSPTLWSYGGLHTVVWLCSFMLQSLQSSFNCLWLAFSIAVSCASGTIWRRYLDCSTKASGPCELRSHCIRFSFVLCGRWIIHLRVSPRCICFLHRLLSSTSWWA